MKQNNKQRHNIKNTNNKADVAPAQCGQHTPGPWLAVILERGKPQTINGRRHSTYLRRECRIVAGSGEEVVNIKLATYIRGPSGDDGRCNDEDAANARLIAAAPELLKALKDLAGEVSVLCHPGEDYERTPLAESWSCAMEVIAKVEGKKR